MMYPVLGPQCRKEIGGHLCSPEGPQEGWRLEYLTCMKMLWSRIVHQRAEIAPGGSQQPLNTQIEKTETSP